ncbi:MAG TPA: TetR/AcrR family transcriptional regulator [Acidimicrobiia bacterium]|nr:TetR/AcrR family transcriptional regulator [Acidimicrobiia bacterium]
MPPRSAGTPDRTDLIRNAALDLALELGFAGLSIEAVAARAGVGKHTIYRRWPSKGALFLDAVLSLNPPALEYPDTGDVMADLRTQVHAAIDLLGRPPFGPLYRALLGEAQHDAAIAAAVNERFIIPQTQRTVARLEAAREQGQISADVDLSLAMAIWSGPLYFRFLVTQEPLTHGYADQVLETLFAGWRPRP